MTRSTQIESGPTQNQFVFMMLNSVSIPSPPYRNREFIGLNPVGQAGVNLLLKLRVRVSEAIVYQPAFVWAAEIKTIVIPVYVSKGGGHAGVHQLLEARNLRVGQGIEHGAVADHHVRPCLVMELGRYVGMEYPFLGLLGGLLIYGKRAPAGDF